MQAGDHIIVSRYVFGNTNSFSGTLRRLGIEVTAVDATNVANVEAAIQNNTRAVFVETIANPVTQIADLSNIGQLCAIANWQLLITPWHRRTCFRQIGAGIVGVSSLTKYCAGRGNALGGTLIDTGFWLDGVLAFRLFPQFTSGETALTGEEKRFARHGNGLSADSAHAISVGMETMALRMERCCKNAIELASFLAVHEKVAKVYYPGLSDHPQHEVAKQHFRHFGAILSIDLQPGLDCFAFLNAMPNVLNATHLGDTRTLAIPVAHTIFYEMGAEVRAEMGISDNAIRF